jgi:hypothetical protein
MRDEKGRFRRDGAEELTFQSYLRWGRVIIIQLTDQPRVDQSFARTHESGRSFDVYTLTIKSTNYQESQDIFDNMRDILIQTSPNATVSHYIIGSLTPAPSRGRWAYETEVEARKTGVIVDAG